MENSFSTTEGTQFNSPTISYGLGQTVRKEIFSVTLKTFPQEIETGMVSSDLNLTSWAGGASLVFVGHPSSDCVTIKIPYGVDVLLDQLVLHSIFSDWAD